MRKSQNRRPDPILLYVYVRNSPMILIDPTGAIIDDSSLKDNKDYQEWKKAFIATKDGKATWDKYHNDKNFSLSITIGDNEGGKYGAETKDHKFNDAGALVGASIVLGTDFAKKAPGDPGDYPVLSSMSDSDTHMTTGGTPIGRRDRAVAFLAHEFGHVDDAAQLGKARWERDRALLEENLANFKKFGQAGLNNPDLLKRCGCQNIYEISMSRENRAERYAIPTIQQYFQKNGGIPHRVKNAIKEFSKKNVPQ